MKREREDVFYVPLVVNWTWAVDKTKVNKTHL